MRKKCDMKKRDLERIYPQKSIKPTKNTMLHIKSPHI